MALPPLRRGSEPMAWLSQSMSVSMPSASLGNSHVSSKAKYGLAMTYGLKLARAGAKS